MPPLVNYIYDISVERHCSLNEAEAAALQLEQGTKAAWYAALKEALHWSNADLLRYVKLKSIIAQPSDRMVVGVSAVEGQAPVAL